MFFWQRRRSAELRLLSAASADPAALCVSVILPLFGPEISTDFHCSTPRSAAATGCSTQHLCTLSCFQNTVSSLGYDERFGSENNPEFFKLSTITTFLFCGPKQKITVHTSSILANRLVTVKEDVPQRGSKQQPSPPPLHTHTHRV